MGGAQYERELRDILRSEGWIVFRSAGSQVADLIALKPNDHMIVEVKSTKANNANLGHDTKSKEQFDLLNAFAKQGFNVYYYVRWKGKKEWSKFKLPMEPYPKLLKNQ